MTKTDLHVAIIDDVPEIAEILSFYIENNFSCQIHTFISGNQFIEATQKQRFDLVFSDMNMPHGNGVDVFRHLKTKFPNVPMILVSSDSVSDHPELDSQIVKGLSKPFTESHLIEVAKPLFEKFKVGMPEPTQDYLTVSFSMLKMIQKIQAPIFVKINDQKYIRIAQVNGASSSEDLAKYEKNGASHLYIEEKYREALLQEFLKQVFSTEAWNEVSDADLKSQAHVNMEAMKNVASDLGWSDDLVEMAQKNTKIALVLGKGNPSLKTVFRQFQKIEKFGFADQCTLLILITSSLAQFMKKDVNAVRKFTFAALYHDMALSDSQIADQHKLLKKLQSNETLYDMKSFMDHPQLAAELCRHWKICPVGVDELVIDQHELPDGSGFPSHKDASSIPEDSALFIIAMDLTHYIAQKSGKFQIENYFAAKEPYFNQGSFLKVFNSLKESIRKTDP
jgi:response regulator RpfG family c-di-GMP phosphodiesterase